MPASDLEGLFEEWLRQFLQTEAAVFGAVEPVVREATKCADLIARAAELGQRWPKLESVEKRAILTTPVGRIDDAQRWKNDV